MNIINAVFTLILITNCSKVVSMQPNWQNCKISEIGSTADKDKAQALLNSGVDINTKGFLDGSMLWHAISHVHEMHDAEAYKDTISTKKRLEFIEFLINNGAELNPTADTWTQVPILCASANNIGPEIIDLFIKHGADINMTHPSHGRTALHLSSWNGDLRVVDFLLKQKNIQIDARDNEGETPLMKAAFCGYVKVVRELLDHGADKTLQDSVGLTAYDHAVKNSESLKIERINKEETVRLLCDKDRN